MMGNLCMYKVENCGGEFYCLLDVVTTMPPLLALRWTEQELLEKSLGTQKSYLDSLKLFYDFWIAKHGVSLDFSFHRSDYHDVEMLTHELLPFWDYLLAGKQITNVVMLPSPSARQKNLTKKKRTAAKHCQVVCNFIEFLSVTYLNTAYRDEDPYVLSRYRTEVKLRLKQVKSKFSKWQKSNKKIAAYSTLRSLTSEQYRDFIRVLTPDIKKAIPVKLRDGSVQASFKLIKENPLNPIISYEVQMRNYLLITLLVRYGLRIGESLLLRKQSFLPSRVDPSKVIMRVRNLEDDDFNDSKMEDARHYKPQIKTADSIRDVEIAAEDYKKIEIYYKFIRPCTSDHDFIFTASMKPYKPVSYSTFQSQFSKVVKAFEKQFPDHFDPQYSEAITEAITPHWLRHTWAYATLAAVYERKKSQYIESGVVNVTGLMEDAKNELRAIGGWSKKSVMPAKYAKRFVQEQASKTVMEVYRNNCWSEIETDLDKDVWDAAFS
ncbi:TPA: site-specific integrase [Vibrio parahaemolyticus]|nr:tyrosine-type recombinase/integrase [Vibrio parahaemolyticus]HAS6784349.1 tyrosine-type recombinase/integrase [Vibrio parahaemolyticus]HAS6792130.1 tyrosine-type recombinase/integrase [Vibrio parahaemolyticus]HAS6881750.1 tyrosine-type recombinase/integrase [Vibrio parahaemolyticus]HAS6897157.1 tyrosine-type recombinase/integrase [Vibrio parahaemolyticus]